MKRTDDAEKCCREKKQGKQVPPTAFPRVLGKLFYLWMQHSLWRIWRCNDNKWSKQHLGPLEPFVLFYAATAAGATVWTMLLFIINAYTFTLRTPTKSQVLLYLATDPQGLGSCCLQQARMAFAIQPFAFYSTWKLFDRCRQKSAIVWKSQKQKELVSKYFQAQEAAVALT